MLTFQTLRPVTLALCLALTAAARGADNTPPQATPLDAAKLAAILPAQPTPIMKVDDVRIGMKGYGLTVFHGAKIEPFNVEVISVMRDFSPGKSVVWIRCPDEVLQKTGPVQGMSGSPIYLWEPGEKQELGKGGKLIGAFAFGFSLTKDCYAGVQPIQNMRDIAQRGVTQKPAPRPDSTPGGALMPSLFAKAVSDLGQPRTNWRARMLSTLAVRQFPGYDRKDNPSPGVATAAAPAPNYSLELNGAAMQARPLALPITLPSRGLAELYGPMLASQGLQALAGPMGVTAGRPPVEIDGDALRFQPGSVLAIPLAYGDMDLSAVGTVTDVLPDGTVLAFGHGMTTEGPTAMPMATGFVHYIVPNLMSSFKLSGSAVVRGSIVRDEAGAVIGRPTVAFETAPVKVTVARPGFPDRTFEYHVTRSRNYTPMLAATLAVQSLTTDANPPRECTIDCTVKMSFADKRELSFTMHQPSGNEQSVAAMLTAPLMMLAENPHQSLTLTAMDVRFKVEPVIRSVDLVEAVLDRDTLRPGETVGLTVKLRPYGKTATTQRVTMKIPADLPDGQYNLTLADPSTYAQLMMQYRPYLRQTASVDDVFDLVKHVLTIDDQAMYLVLELPQHGLAVGRQTLPSLPSSRSAMLTSSNSTLTTLYTRWTQKLIPLGAAPSGEATFTLNVKKEPKSDNP